MSVSEEAVRTALAAMEAELKLGDSPRRSTDYLAVKRWQAVLQAASADDGEIQRLTIRALTLLTWVPTIGEFLALRKPTADEQECLWQAAIEAAVAWTPYSFGEARREGSETAIEAFENPPPTLPTPEATEALRSIGADAVRGAIRSGDPWEMREMRDRFVRALLAGASKTNLAIESTKLAKLAGQTAKSIDNGV